MTTRQFHGITPTRKDVWFELTSDTLAATPAWGLDAPNPPLAIRDAIRIGHRTFLEFVEHEIEWELTSVELVHEEEVDRWLYRLNYQLLRDPKGNPICIMGRPYYLPIIVLMNGNALEQSSLPGADQSGVQRWVGML
jgi:hypothetical protein